MKNIKSFLWFILGVVVLGATSLYFGGEFLEGPLVGGDDAHALFHINYLYNHWPDKILWQPNHGAGLPLYGLNFGAFWFAAMSARVFGWTTIQALHLWQWLNIYLASLGTFVLGWTLLGPLVGIIAGFFFLLSQVSWFWQARIGLFAFQASFVFVPLFFTFLHSYYQRHKKHGLFKKLLLLSLTSIALAFSFSFHFVVAVLVIVAAFFYILLTASSKQSFWRRFKAYLLIVFTALIFSAPWLIPFVNHNQRIFGGEIDYLSLKSIPSPPLKMFLGLGEYSSYVDLWYGFFALPVLFLSGLGTIIAFIKKNRKVFTLFFLSLIFALSASSNNLFPSFAKFFAPYFSLTNIRSILIPIIFIPLVAAYGVVISAKTIFAKVKNNFFNSILVFISSFLIVIAFVWKFDRIPTGFKGRCGSSYGPEGKSIYCGLGINEVFIRSLKGIIKPSTEGPAFEKLLTKIAAVIPASSNLRVDVTTRRGEYIQLWGSISDIPILQSANFTRVIPVEYWNYQIDNFYRDRGNWESVGQIASWFGIDYVVLEEAKDDPLEKYANWEKVAEIEGVQIRKSPNPVGLATYSNRPAILFIGDPEQDAYFKWWQLLVNGGMDYRQAFIVNGGKNIEDFKLEELSNFDLLVLWGERYKRKDRANNLVRNYLEQGGRVLIDTGWQYTSPFWQEEELPEWMPIMATEWQSFDSWELKSSDLSLEELITSWKVPKWEGNPWGASVAKKDSLRPNSEVLLLDETTKNVIIVKRKVGKGEVVWTGLNFVGMYQVNDPTVEDIHKHLVGNLLPSQGDDFQVEVRRPEPEKVEIQFAQQSSPLWLYWRESYYPSWRAKSSREKLANIYKSGPGLILLRIPENTSKITLYHGYYWPIIIGRTLFVAPFLIGVLWYLRTLLNLHGK